MVHNYHSYDFSRQFCSSIENTDKGINTCYITKDVSRGGIPIPVTNNLSIRFRKKEEAEKEEDVDQYQENHLIGREEYWRN